MPANSRWDLIQRLKNIKILCSGDSIGDEYVTPKRCVHVGLPAFTCCVGLWSVANVRAIVTG